MNKKTMTKERNEPVKPDMRPPKITRQVQIMMYIHIVEPLTASKVSTPEQLDATSVERCLGDGTASGYCFGEAATRCVAGTFRSRTAPTAEHVDARTQRTRMKKILRDIPNFTCWDQIAVREQYLLSSGVVRRSRGE
jgi:hypothetical protein